MSIFALKILDHLENRASAVEGRAEAFDVVYHNRFWQRVVEPPASADPTAAAAASSVSAASPVSAASQTTGSAARIIFRKNDQNLVFDESRRLVIALIGTACSGKTTQGELLEKALGMISTSDGEIFQQEESGSLLKKMVTAFSAAHKEDPLPSELHLGMMARRLSRSDCLPGFILRGFPSSEEQCDILLRIFIRNTDVFHPIYLNIPDEDVRSRLQEDSSGERRLADFNRSKEGVLSRLEICHLQTLPLAGSTSILEIFHQISLGIQTRLDTLGQQQAASAASAKPQKPEAAKQAASSKYNPTNIVMVGGVVVIVFVAGMIFARSR